MEGLAEALETIQETAVKASHAQRLMDKRKGTVFSHGGQILTIDADPPARNHKVSDLESLVVAIGGEASASVWHSGNQVVAIIDDTPASHRDDRVSWSLVESAKFAALTRKAAEPRSHAEFVKFLVQNLRDELQAAAPGLLGAIRALKFRSADEQAGKIEHGRESMGRAIEAEVTGAGELPETVVVKVPRWATLGLDYVASIECLLVLDVNDRKLSLRPLADQLERAENAAQRWLNDLLSGSLAEASVLYGTP